MAIPDRQPVIPKLKEKPIQPAELPLEAKRNPDPKLEHSRQMELGRDAFAQAEFGRAQERFRQAVKAAPQQSAAHFSLAQSQFAVGKYREAVASILQGLKTRPDWPKARFQPRESYGNNPGLFDKHLQALKDALDARPDDAGLLFLYGYQLWFDGRSKEAIPILEKALERTTDPEPIQLFLVGGMVIRKQSVSDPDFL